jgi:hypothetical protein
MGVKKPTGLGRQSKNLKDLHVCAAAFFAALGMDKGFNPQGYYDSANRQLNRFLFDKPTVGSHLWCNRFGLWFGSQELRGTTLMASLVSSSVSAYAAYFHSAGDW